MAKKPTTDPATCNRLTNADIERAQRQVAARARGQVPPSDIDDVVQDAVMRALGKFDPSRGTRLATLAVRIVADLIADRHRRAAVEKAHEEIPLGATRLAPSRMVRLDGAALGALRDFCERACGLLRHSWFPASSRAVGARYLAHRIARDLPDLPRSSDPNLGARIESMWAEIAEPRAEISSPNTVHAAAEEETRMIETVVQRALGLAGATSREANIGVNRVQLRAAKEAKDADVRKSRRRIRAIAALRDARGPRPPKLGRPPKKKASAAAKKGSAR